MKQFPSPARKPSNIKWNPADKGITQIMKDGLEKSRARFTKTRYESIEVSYPAITYAEYEAILDFWNDEAFGSSVVFEWTCNDPKSKYYNRVFEVRMSAPDFGRVSPGYWSGSVTFRGELKNA